jgi:hypothetical protein
MMTNARGYAKLSDKSKGAFDLSRATRAPVVTHTERIPAHVSGRGAC